MTENEAINTLSYLLGYENAVDKGELDAENHLNSQEKEALQFILEEIQQYRAIGTVEELKALREKNEPKKVVVEHVPKTSWTREVSHYLCPCCNHIFSFGGTTYCSCCGQKIDWQ